MLAVARPVQPENVIHLPDIRLHQRLFQRVVQLVREEHISRLVGCPRPLRLHIVLEALVDQSSLLVVSLVLVPRGQETLLIFDQVDSLGLLRPFLLFNVFQLLSIPID